MWYLLQAFLTPEAVGLKTLAAYKNTNWRVVRKKISKSERALDAEGDFEAMQRNADQTT